jgi:hypothetical protein
MRDWACGHNIYFFSSAWSLSSDLYLIKGFQGPFLIKGFQGFQVAGFQAAFNIYLPYTVYSGFQYNYIRGCLNFWVGTVPFLNFPSYMRVGG